MRPGDDGGEVVVRPRLDVHQPRVRRPGDVGEQGPADRVEDRLGGQERVDADDDDDPGERVEHLDQAALVDDRVDVDPRQVVHRLRLDGRHHALGQVAPAPAEVEVVDQAVLELGVRLLDRPGGVEAVDAADQGQDDPIGGEGGRPGEPEDQGDHPEPGRQAVRQEVVEQDLQEEAAQQGRRQQDPGGEDVGHLDLRPGQAELMVDELLVIEQLALRLRARGHINPPRGESDPFLLRRRSTHGPLHYSRPAPPGKRPVGRMSDFAHGRPPHLPFVRNGPMVRSKSTPRGGRRGPPAEDDHTTATRPGGP